MYFNNFSNCIGLRIYIRPSAPVSKVNLYFTVLGGFLKIIFPRKLSQILDKKHSLQMSFIIVLYCIFDVCIVDNRPSPTSINSCWQVDIY